MSLDKKPMVQRWGTVGGGAPLDEAAVRLRYSQERGFRVATSRVVADDVVAGVTKAMTLVVLAGDIECIVGTSIWRLAAGDVLESPPGAYELKGGDVGATIVKIWRLPY